jgi:hypothetical protein
VIASKKCSSTTLFKGTLSCVRLFCWSLFPFFQRLHWRRLPNLLSDLAAETVAGLCTLARGARQLDDREVTAATTDMGMAAITDTGTVTMIIMDTGMVTMDIGTAITGMDMTTITADGTDPGGIGITSTRIIGRTRDLRIAVATSIIHTCVRHLLERTDTTKAALSGRRMTRMRMGASQRTTERIRMRTPRCPTTRRRTLRTT